MHPILTVVHIGPRSIPIASYGVMVCLGLAVVAAGLLRVAARARLDLGACIAALGLAASAGFMGAVLLHVAVQCIRLHSFSEGLSRPGVAYFGGALAGTAALLWASRAQGVPGLLLLDRAVPAIAIGHALGRVGCFLGGCCYGRPYDGPLAVHFRDALAPAALPRLGRHPVQLYEAFGLLALSLWFARRPPRRAGSGERAFAYAASYGALRFGLEFLRGDEVRGVFFGGALSTSQLIALCVVGAWALGRARALAFVRA